MRDSFDHNVSDRTNYRIVIVTLDSHNARPCERALMNMLPDFDGLQIDIFAAAEWDEDPETFTAVREAIAQADIIVINLLFLEHHVKRLLPEIQLRRNSCDAIVGMISDAELVKQTKMGALDMLSPQSNVMSLLKKLRGSSKPSSESGEKKMRMLRRLPKILKFIPGKSQDLRAWFLAMQYWLGGTDENIESMLRFLISRYSRVEGWRGCKTEMPKDYPDVGLYHPDSKEKIVDSIEDLPKLESPVGTIGILLMRSYVLSGDTAHYDAVIKRFTEHNIQVIPAFSGGLDARPAIEKYFKNSEKSTIDGLLSLTGFSLVGGPAYNDSEAAVSVLKELNLPYVAAHPLEFQTLPQWSGSSGGLGPIETTMLVALPELDGAINPTVFAGRYGNSGQQRAMAPCNERINILAERCEKTDFIKKETS